MTPSLSRPRIDPQRTSKMYDLYANGATLQEVGDRFGLSRQRVQQIFIEANLPTRSIGETYALRHEHLLERAKRGRRSL